MGNRSNTEVEGLDTLDPNLLASKRSPKTEEKVKSPTSNAVKLALYVGIFIVAFILFLLLKIPDSAVSNFVLNTANQNTPLRWQAERIGVRFFLLPHLRADSLSFEPLQGGGEPIKLDILKIYPRIHRLIPWSGQLNPSFSFSGSAYLSEFSGSASIRNNQMDSLSFETKNSDLAKLTPLIEAGIDIRGKLETLDLDFDIDKGDWSKASGYLTTKGKNIVFDPGALRLPIALPILDLGLLDIDADIKSGKLTIKKAQLGSAGKDLEIKIQGQIQLNKNLVFSLAELNLQVKPSPRILQSIQALKSMLETFGAKRPDGFYAMKLRGPVSNIGLPTPDK